MISSQALSSFQKTNTEPTWLLLTKCVQSLRLRDSLCPSPLTRCIDDEYVHDTNFRVLFCCGLVSGGPRCGVLWCVRALALVERHKYVLPTNMTSSTFPHLHFLTTPPHTRHLCLSLAFLCVVVDDACLSHRTSRRRKMTFENTWKRMA